MLKKLLASTLAVATVATCAYVPSALASADTTYVTANIADYYEWTLKNPGVNTNQTVTIYVSGSGAAASGAYTMSVKPEDNTVEYVEAHIADAKFDADNTLAKKQTADGKTLTASHEMNKSLRYVVSYVAAAGANNYVANVSEQRAVVYHPYDGVYGSNTYNTPTFAVTSTDADTLNGKGLKLLGYYDTANNAAVKVDTLSELTQAKHINEAKVADWVFRYWSFVQGDGNEASYAVPVYAPIEDAYNTTEYTPVDVFQFDGSLSTGTKASALTSGLYNSDRAAGEFTLKLAKSESASWTLALNNWLKVAARHGDITAEHNLGDDGIYDAAAVRYVAPATTTPPANAQYVVVYTKRGDGDKKVTYNLKYAVVDSKFEENGGTGAGGLTSDYNTGDLGINYANAVEIMADKEWAASDFYFTTDAEAVYNKFKAANDKATLAEYLANLGGDDVKYVWNGKYSVVNTDTVNRKVTLVINVVKYEKYTIYSFGPDNSVAKTEAFLCADDVKLVSYTSKDASDKFAPASVIKASAEKLGASETATIKDVPATYAYSNIVDNANNIIYSTYKMGDATVEAADFATSTGAFDAEAYFGRAAKAGDVVTLKVSFSDQGDAKKFELKNVTVKYDVIGATKGETFEYATKYTNDYKNGVATEFVLAEGANIITGTVTYNGKTVTLAPFYAYVG